MASKLTHRSGGGSGGTGFTFNGVAMDAGDDDIYGSLMANQAPAGAPMTAGAPSAMRIAATEAGYKTGGKLDPTAQLREAGVPVRELSLTGGIDLDNLLSEELQGQTVKYGKMLGWVRLILAALYAITALALLFVVIFESNGEFPFFWDPIRYSKLDGKWEAAMEKVSNVHVDWALVALLATFAIYHAVHFFPFVRDIYLRLVFWYQMNAIRWIFHGVAGGLMVAFYAVIMGVSNVIVFVLLGVVVIGGAAAVLFSEMINRPKLYFVGDKEEEADLVANHELTAEDATAAVRDGYFIKPGAVTPWPILAALVLLLTYVGVTSAYFWTAVEDSASHVPWYVWTTYFITMLSFVVIAVVNVLRLLVSWRIFQNYFYFDILHNAVELAFIWLATVLVIIGFSVSA